LIPRACRIRFILIEIFALLWIRLFYQNAIGMFNEANPSGGVTSSNEYQTVLIVAIVVSFVVAVKRFWLGLVQGKRTYRKCFMLRAQKMR
jgi:hypothetical protein